MSFRGARKSKVVENLSNVALIKNEAVPLQRSQVSLPLLAKELTEQAARRRTYVVRVIYALILFAVVVIFLIDFNYHRTPLRILGRGRFLLQAIVFAQFFGIYLLLPAACCGLLTEEKERNTLGLLFLTRLGPWTILIEKLLGRLIPMLMYVLLTLPILGIAYTLGGVSQSHLWSGVWLLIAASLQMSTLGVMCSAWFRTTAGAFIATYAIGCIVCFSLPFLDEMHIINIGWEAQCAFFPPFVFETASGMNFLKAFGSSIPTLILSGVFLVLARAFIVERAFARPTNVIMNVIRPMDRFFSSVIVRVTSGRVKLDVEPDLPGDDPVAWRETARTVLGRFRYQLYIAVATTLLVCCALVAISSNRGRNDEELAAVIFIFLAVVTLLVCVKSACLFASERSRQTYDVLMTTPLTNRELLDQKMAGIYRLMLTFVVPFLVIVMFDAWWKLEHWGSFFRRRSYNFPTTMYVFSTVITVAIYLPMLSWLCVLVGLKVRNQVRAIFTSLIIIGAWAIAPIFFLIMFIEVTGISHRDVSFLLITSPLPYLLFNEVGETDEMMDSAVMLLILNSLIYGSILLALRSVCLNNLDLLLKRSDAAFQLRRTRAR